MRYILIGLLLLSMQVPATAYDHASIAQHSSDSYIAYAMFLVMQSTTCGDSLFLTKLMSECVARSSFTLL